MACRYDDCRGQKGTLFDTVADQTAYQDHPAHQAFVAAYGPLWPKGIVYDSVPA